MTTFTVELDPTTADALAKAASERSVRPEALIANAAAWWLLDQAGEPAWSDEDIAAIEEGMAQLERGQSTPQETLMARLEAKYGG